MLATCIDFALSTAQSLLPDGDAQTLNDGGVILALRALNLLLQTLQVRIGVWLNARLLTLNADPLPSLVYQAGKTISEDVKSRLEDAVRRVSRALQSLHLLFQLEAAYSYLQGVDVEKLQDDPSEDVMYCQRLIASVYLAKKEESSRTGAAAAAGSALLEKMERLAWKLLRCLYRPEEVAQTARDALRADVREVRSCCTTCKSRFHHQTSHATMLTLLDSRPAHTHTPKSSFGSTQACSAGKLVRRVKQMCPW